MVFMALTLKKLVNTLGIVHNKTLWNRCYLQVNLFIDLIGIFSEGLVCYAINSILFINTLKEKYNKIYEKLIYRLEICANAIRILSKGYLPIFLLPLTKLKAILDEVKKASQITNPDYDIVIKRLHLYYDMKLVTFGINKESSLIDQFPIFIQPYI